MDIENLEDIDCEITEDENCIEPKKVLFYEPEYEDVKNDPNKVWLKYSDRIRKTLKIMAYWKNFDIEELYQQAYIYYVDLCKIYIPFYQGSFIPFDKYIFKNIIIKLRAFIQNYYLKYKREQPTEINERTLKSSNKSDMENMNDKLFIEYIYSLISKRQQQILDLTYKGYKQQEIGEMLDISQSRVSVIKKRTIRQIQSILEKKGKLM